MRSAVNAAALIFASAWFLDRMGTYSGSKSFSTSTPSWLLGRSMMWPLEASPVKPRPRNFESVRDLVGDSTMTSERARDPAGGASGEAGSGAPPRVPPGAAPASLAASEALRAARERAPRADRSRAAGLRPERTAPRRAPLCGVPVGAAPGKSPSERAGAAASLSAARARFLPGAVFAPRALVDRIGFAMQPFRKVRAIVAERHARRHLAGELDAHRRLRPPVRGGSMGEDPEHALELP